MRDEVEASAPADGDPFVGTVVGGRYRLLRRIGEGGMGSVYRAEDRSENTVVALKLLHSEMGRNEEMIRRFEREARSMNLLSHEGIVRVLDFGRAEVGALYLVMELVRGESLEALLNRVGRLPIPRAVRIAGLLLRALEHAHGQGVVHRDLKPENVIVLAGQGRDAEKIKLFDFGIAKLVGRDQTQLTKVGAAFGTPAYMSPEQAMGREVDGRADLYACGLILYRMLAGRPPFISDDPVRLMTLQVNEMPPPLAEVAPEARVPASLEAVLVKAVAKKREERFPSATEFLRALEAVGGAPPGVQPAAVGSPRARASSGRGETRRGGRRWLGAIVMVLLLGGAGLLVGPGRRLWEPSPADRMFRIEELIARAQLAPARALIDRELTRAPQSGRVRFLLGTLEFAEKRPREGLAAYREALSLDRSLGSEADLIRNVRAAFEEGRLAEGALDLLNEIGPPACATLAKIASTDRRGSFRKIARAATARHGCGTATGSGPAPDRAPRSTRPSPP